MLFLIFEHHYYQKALEIRLTVLGKKHPQVAGSYNGIGITHKIKGDYDKALEYHQKALGIRLATLGKKHPKVATSYNNIGVIYQIQGDYGKALEYHLKSLEIRLSVHGEKHPKVATSYNNIGVIYQIQGDYDKALEYHLKSLEIRLSVYGEKHPKVAGSYNNIGTIYQTKGDYDKALECRHKSLEIKISTLGEKHPDVATSYNNIGTIYQTKGDYDKALECHHKSLEIRIAILGEKHPGIASSYLNIGSVYQYKGDNYIALEYFYKTLEIMIPSLEEKHPNAAIPYMKIGKVFQYKGDYDKALEYHYKSLEITLSVHGEKHPGVATAYHNIGIIMYQNQEDYDKALEYFYKAVEIRIATLGEKHPNVAASYQNIGIIYRKKGDYDKALQYLDKSLEIRIASFGEKHHEVGGSFRNIGSIYHYKGENKKALEYCHKALTANLKQTEDIALLYQSPHRIKAFNPKGFLLSYQLRAQIFRSQFEQNKALDKLQHALLTYQQCDTLIGKIYQSHFNYGDKITFNQTALDIYLEAQQVSQLLYHETAKEQYLKTAFYFAEKGKANVLLQSISGSDALQFSGIPNTLIQKEKNLKIDIAHYEKQVQQFSENKDTALLVRYRDDYLFNATRELEALVQTMEQDYPDYYNMKYNHSVTTAADIQEQLDDRTLFVEYVIDRQEYLIREEERKPQVHIFTISQKGLQLNSVEWQSGSDEHLTELYQLLPQTSIVKTRKKERFIELSHQLYRQLIRPIEVQLEGIERIVFVGEDKLHYLPFEVLLKNGENKDFSELDYLLKDFEISYHYSATLYADSQKKEGKNGFQNLLAFAPVFGDASGSAVTSSESRYWADPTFQGLRSGSFQHLPWSEKEVKAIHDLFVSKGIPRNALLLHDEANEGALKMQAPGEYGFIHIASHGFANPGQPRFSGIACAQLQQDSTNNEDGILYVGEVYNLELNADLVVLSSCESGVGKLVKGEGMLGLNRSFVYAGSPNIVFSLWQVNDEKSSELMVEFYQQVLEGKSYAAALRQSKLGLLQKKESALPVYWSAFVLMGR